MAILRWRPMGQSVERWDPFREVGDFQSELNRVFDGFFGSLRDHGLAATVSGRPRSTCTRRRTISS